jgi:GAF domain-containing protein
MPRSNIPGITLTCAGYLSILSLLDESWTSAPGISYAERAFNGKFIIFGETAIMNSRQLFSRLSVENQGLNYKLSIIFALFFLAPVAGFMYFAIKYDILRDKHIPLYFIALLIFSFFGLIMLRKLFDEVTRIAKSISKTIAEDFSPSQTLQPEDELKSIVHSFQTFERELRGSLQNLDKKTSDISTLREMSDLCFITFNPEDLLYITLERALRLTNADIGSVMILEKPKRDTFIIEASIGLGDIVPRGMRISFADSIAKHAVINKTPLLVEDIETDMRFARHSRPQYAIKSFICLPLKTINDVIGVLTISRKTNETPFTQEDVDILVPLLSNATFTFDNLRLSKESENRSIQLKAMENLSSIINSSFRSSELLHAILNEIREVIAYDLAIILITNEENRQGLFIADFQTLIPSSLNKGQMYVCDGTVFDKAMKQQKTLILHDTGVLSHPVEIDILLDHGARNALLTPLKMEGRVTGILVMCNIHRKGKTAHRIRQAEPGVGYLETDRRRPRCLDFRHGQGPETYHGHDTGRYGCGGRLAVSAGRERTGNQNGLQCRYGHRYPEGKPAQTRKRDRGLFRSERRGPDCPECKRIPVFPAGFRPHDGF